MQRLLGILLVLLCFQLTFAQYTDLINSRRPGFSDSPFSVGTDVLQFEGGVFYRNIDDRGTSATSYGTDLMIRYSKFLEKLELNLNTTFQYDDIDFADSFVMADPSLENVSKFGIGRLTIGAKYLVYSPKYTDKSKEVRSWKRKTAYDWKRLIPAVAVYAGVNLPVTKSYIGGNSPAYVEDEFSPRLAIFTQNNFTDKFVFLMNLVMDKVGSDYFENSYILTGTYSVTDKWSIFGEHQGIFKGDGIPNDFQFGGGVAYLFNRNTQFDIAARTISDRDGSTLLLNAGLSWRLDRYKDKFKVVGADGEAVEKQKKEGNFFSRLFGKNKPTKQRKVKKIKARKRKIKKDKPPKKTKAQKRREKEAKKRAKDERKKQKKAAKDYNKNYEPPEKN
ncbi:MAG: transporter [Flavobacteriaceae bacterium]|nr:transporter [Flavobacteriaceae bacterium]